MEKSESRVSLGFRSGLGLAATRENGKKGSQTMEEKGEKLIEMLQREKLKLEKKYCVQVSTCALDLAVESFLNLKLIPGAANPKKVVEILDGVCQLVLEKFRTCDYESKFCQKAYELRRALVELIELKRDSHPDSESWLTRLKQERDFASIYISDFLEKWEPVLTSSRGEGILTPECAEKLNGKSFWELSSTPENMAGGFLDDIEGQLIECFQRLLTVKARHVAEMVSILTDVPFTQVLPSTDHLKEKAKCKTKQRVVDQDHVIDEVFETMCYAERVTTRPRGSFLLLGPPGVGKTEIAKAVAENWYCDVGRLLKIDMSEYAEPQLESASCDLSEWAKEKNQNLWNRLTEAVGKRPYSVILLDKIDEAAASVTGILLEVLNNNTPSDTEWGLVDFSNSIIFMSSSVGANQLELACNCFEEDFNIFKQFSHNPQEFYLSHNCDLTGSGCERVVREARKFFGSNLLDSFDKVIVMEKLWNWKAVARLLLREIVKEVTGERVIVHASNVALDALLRKASTKSVGTGMAIKESLQEHVIPQLAAAAAAGHNGVIVFVDTLYGTYELSFRFQTHKVYMDDRYFKQKDGTFGKCVANLRMKMEAVYGIFNLRRNCSTLLVSSYQNMFLGKLSICSMILLFSPFPNPPSKLAYEAEPLGDEAPNHLLTVEEKKKIENQWISLQDNVTGVAKATGFILDSVLKIANSPLQLPDLPTRHYLFLGLDDDARMELIDGLRESLISSSARSLFRHVKLDYDCHGEIQRKLLIEEVKEKPCMVLLFDGVEFADDVLYRSLLEIFDDGSLNDDEGSAVDFRRTIVILTSTEPYKRAIAERFNYRKSCVLRDMGVNQVVKRFRTELLYRVYEIICFDPLLSVHGHIIREGRCMVEPRRESMFRPLFEFLT